MNGAKLIRPKGAWLNVNRKCNFRCLWCYTKGTHYNPRDNMSLETSLKIIDMLHDIDVQIIDIIGGEPTLWPYLTDLNKYAHSLGMMTSIVTNAAKFADNEYWERYLLNPCDFANISVKGATPKQLNEVAKVTRFSSVKLGIQRAVKYYQTGIGTVYSTLIEDSLIGFAEFAVDCGAKYLNLQFCSAGFCGGKSVSEYMIDPRIAAQNVFRDYPELDRILEGKISFEINTPFCTWPQDFLKEILNKGQVMSVCNVFDRSGIVFDIDGKIAMCNALYNYPIGQYGVEFNDSDSFIRHINQPVINDYYDQLTRMPSELCASCKWYDSCGGGCPLNWAIYSPKDLITPISSEGGD